MSHKSKRVRQSNFIKICSECRDHLCCFGTRPPITSERKRKIGAYLQKENIPLTNAFTKTDYVFPTENAEGHCGFYNVETATCLIHHVKPETCVAGPITFDINKRSGGVEWHIKMEKICPLAGVMYKDKQLLQKHLKSAKGEIFRLIRGLDSAELEAILKKDEPDTFKIGEDSQQKMIRHETASG